ncbi:MAG: glycosyltransferase family 2 protein [Lachnospiraceae bacterium]
MKVTVVIPNYNGMKYLKDCMEALDAQTYPAHILIVDNASTDGSVQWIKENYPLAELICLPENTGFCGAVNVGIRNAKTPYVILLNNDTKVKSGFIKELVEAIETSERIFSVSAQMLDMKNEEILDNAGDLYCALGWAYARGKGKKAVDYGKPARIFSACGGAAIYRRSVFEKIGYFDEMHFAYLEDVDIGWRARIYGYENRYEPKARVLHAGSGVSGSRYNKFKANLSSTNSVYIIGKNMPVLQLVINLPFLIAGFLIKTLFFARKGMGIIYFKGCLKGVKRCFSEEGRERKVRFQIANLGNYCRIQVALWYNILRRFQN